MNTNEFITKVKQQQGMLRGEQARYRREDNLAMYDYVSGQLQVLGWTLYCLEGEQS